MENYYNLLGINTDSTKNEIINAYNYKISKYNNFDLFSNDNIKEIKSLKTALFILCNKKLRKKYNKLIKNNDIKPYTLEDNNDLDSLFKIEPITSFPEHKIFNPNDTKKNRSENTYVNDRTFQNIYNVK